MFCNMKFDRSMINQIDLAEKCQKRDSPNYKLI